MVYGALCLDEGCYGKAIVKSRVRFGILPWQGNEWDELKPDYVTQIDKELWNVQYCSNLRNCRSKLELDLPDRKNHQRMRDFYSGKSLNNEGIYSKRFSVKIGNPDCMWWIDSKFQTCVKGDIYIPAKSAYAIIVSNGLVEVITWKHINEADGFGPFEMMDLRELMIFHIGKWKTKKTLRYITRLRSPESEALRIEMTVLDN
jgi:hypothetical protein